jgi:hypothetical protein
MNRRRFLAGTLGAGLFLPVATPTPHRSPSVTADVPSPNPRQESSVPEGQSPAVTLFLCGNAMTGRGWNAVRSAGSGCVGMPERIGNVPEPDQRSNRAMDSTWAVWGNMSMTPAPTRR